jgi:hypothetical protein
VAVYFGLDYIPGPDNPTKFFFHYFLPYTFLSFFVYGLWPVICLKIGLVDSDGFEIYMKKKSGKFNV